MLHRIVKAEARSDHRLWVRFEDGVEGEVSVAHLVGKGVFATWEDEAEFARVSIDPESGTVVWPGGADLAPDALYREISSSSAAASHSA